MMQPLKSGQVSTEALDCLLDLKRIHISEREEIGQLNDKFVDIIEHVHFLEAEAKALRHDIDLKKSGKLNYSSGINSVFELEISNLHVVVENCVSSRQHFRSEISSLENEVETWIKKWRSIAKSNLGIPKDVDDEFVRLSQIEAENNLVLRRIKYLEDKHKAIGYKNNMIRDEINMMKMRTDQAVTLQHEYSMRQTDLINSIRNMKIENERVIMNEHKFFVTDRTADRHAFRNSLHQAIAEIRADYEQRRLLNERTIRENCERKIIEINAKEQVVQKRDDIRVEIFRTKESVRVLHKQFSDAEIRNANLIQQIESLTYETKEENRIFEISLAERQAEIERLRRDCEKLSDEMKKLCDINISLSSEIARYRQLLDGSAQRGAGAGAGAATFGTARYQVGSGTAVGIPVGTSHYQIGSGTTSVETSRHESESRHFIGTGATVVETPRPDSGLRWETGSITAVIETPRPFSGTGYQIGSGVAAVETTRHERETSYNVGTGTTVFETSRPASSVRYPTGSGVSLETTRHESESRHQFGTGVGFETTRPNSGLRYQVGTGTGIETTQHDSSSRYSVGEGAGYETTYTGTTVYQPTITQPRHYTPTPYVFQETPLPVIPPPARSPRYNHSTNDSESSTGVSTVISHSSATRPVESYRQQREIIDTYHDRTDVRPVIPTTTTFPVTTPILERTTTEFSYGRDNGGSHYDRAHQTRTEQVTSSSGQIQLDSRSQFEGNSQYLNTGRNEQCVKNIHSQDVNSSFDEDHFQRFTRWYKGRVKISDVTTNYISLENRSSKHSADIGGYRIIHEFGESSVFVDLPGGLILGPKETLKIFSKNSSHEYGVVVADIPNFDTTTLSNTSIRNNQNEVKSWFVYTSNSDTTEHLI